MPAPRFRNLTAVSLAVLLMLLNAAVPAGAQPAATNYDESLVPAYELPDPLVAEDGEEITTPEMWWEKRRPEILTLFEREVYGRAPTMRPEIRFETQSIDESALGGVATRKQIEVFFSRREDAPSMNLLLYVPNDVEGPLPAFLALNFAGNHTIHTDPGILISDTWVREKKEKSGAGGEPVRGARSSRWPVEQILERGFAFATVYYEDITPDRESGLQDGVHPHYYAEGQERPAPDEWGAIASWAWGLSRAMDYLATDDDIEEEDVALMGHSRLGKAALWAGALDQRFAYVISNNSGAGGAALSRRQFGERVDHLNERFPHWFADNFEKYDGREDQLPVDQHMLIALIAPRPVYITSAEEDRWADPRGEFLAAKHAAPVYRLLGKEGPEVSDMPAVEEPITGTIGYHIRRGAHDVTLYDWERWMDWIRGYN